MNFLRDMTFKRLIYWLTDHSEGSTKLFRLWIFIAFTSAVLFLVSELAGSNTLFVVAIVIATIWSTLSLIYLLREIVRGVRFLIFKKRTQKKDEPFEVPQISSSRKLKPDGFDRAG